MSSINWNRCKYQKAGWEKAAEKWDDKLRTSRLGVTGVMINYEVLLLYTAAKLEPQTLFW